MNRASSVLSLALLAVSSQATGCSRSKIVPYTPETAIQARESPQAIENRLVSELSLMDEREWNQYPSDAVALGKIVVRGNQWGYSLDDRKAAFDALVSAAERINANLRPHDATSHLSEPSRQLVRIALAASNRCFAAEVVQYTRVRVANIPPGPLLDAFRNESAAHEAIPTGPFFGEPIQFK